ncbi:uncharacterized protein LOC124135459 [Haliotis rufescens]|uniref:uncharacterized protein LOC124135459 n=1 Tax=Haliotis rufescens TaxID=6454 RepID=UPI00201F68FA|nr:uncharacterized protein LOC124135459 [Haliotis rufescens]
MEECSEASLYSNEEEVNCPGPLFRVKMFVMGDVGCGKTSLVQSLIGPTPKLNDNPTDGVKVELWYPFKTSKHNENLLDRKLSGEEHHLIIEIWDMTGRQVCQHAHQMYLTRESIFLLLYNRVDHTSCDSVLPIYTSIQEAAPGSTVIIASTKADKSPPDGNRATLPSGEQILDSLRKSLDNWRFYVLKEMDELKLLSRETHAKHPESANKSKKNDSRHRHSETNPALKSQMEACESILVKVKDVPSKVYDVSSLDGQGLDELKTVIFRAALDPVKFPHLDRTIKPSTISLYDEILKLRERDLVLLTWGQFCDIANQLSPDGDDTLEEDTAFLQTIGGLLDFKMTPSISNTPDNPPSNIPAAGTGRFICIHPSVFANAVCCCLVDDDKKAFRFESCRFWPKDSGFKRPDPQVLCKVLESIPHEGLIRESLLPLLWQESNLYEDQILHLVRVFTYLGLFIRYCTCKANCEGLALPYYPHLSVQRCLYAVLLDLLPNNRPQLNWTPKPFKGDLQITIGYIFATGLPVGVAKQLLAHCQYVGQDTSSYRHMWKYGVLQRVGEAIVCAEHDNTQFNISCRVNADEPGQEDSAVQLLWVSLSQFLLSLNKFLKFWPGLFYKMVIMPLGYQFYHEEKVEHEQMVSLLRCLSYWLADKKYSFKDGEVEREIHLELLFPFRDCPTLHCVDDWLTFVLTKKHLVFPSEESNTIMEPNADTKTALKINPLLLLSKGSMKLKSRKKKSVEVKWKLDPLGDKTPPPQPMTGTSSTNTTHKPDANQKTEDNKEETTPFAQNTTPVVSGTEESNSIPPVTGVALPCGKGVVMKAWSEEEEVKEATRIASGFVAAIMASAVAEFISSECESSQMYKEVVSAAQVAAARVTAEAARAAQTGDIDGAAKAVLQAVKAVEIAMGKSSTSSGQGPIRSRLCVIL